MSEFGSAAPGERAASAGPVEPAGPVKPVGPVEPVELGAETRVRWLAALAGGLLLGMAAPPALLPLGEWLVLPGLAIWFSLATASRRPLFASYLFGCLYMAWFSWSVRHVLLPAYLAIVVVGGLYFVLGTAAVRGAPSKLRSVAFGVAVAGSFWLRACMPEIYYPHGQPCHSLWQWPSLMHLVVYGGEPGMNAWLGVVAAMGCELWRSWRTAATAWRASWIRFGVVSAAGIVLALLAVPSLDEVGEAVGPARAPVRIAAIEPGFHPEEFLLQPVDQWLAVYRKLLRERLVQPTAELLTREPDLDLVVWPESTWIQPVSAADLEAGRAVMRGLLPASRARLLIGANVRTGEGGGRNRMTPSALLLELPSGRILDHQGKQWLVPGGEFLPLLGLLPESLAASVREAFRAALGTAPDCRAAAARAPMATSGGRRFGSLLCYDNGFPGPARSQVEQGAEFLVVLSNEAWYRGGAELTQLVAMTVVRAIENRVPIVRCTLDGLSVAVDARGQVVAGLELGPAPQPQARILEVSVAGRSGPVPPMAWLRRFCGQILAILMSLGVAHGLWRWVRIRAASTAPSSTASPGPSR